MAGPSSGRLIRRRVCPKDPGFHGFLRSRSAPLGRTIRGPGKPARRRHETDLVSRFRPVRRLELTAGVEHQPSPTNAWSPTQPLTGAAPAAGVGGRSCSAGLWRSRSPRGRWRSARQANPPAEERRRRLRRGACGPRAASSPSPTRSAPSRRWPARRRAHACRARRGSRAAAP